MITEALKTVEKLTVLIYEAPGLTEVPLTRRANWIRTFNPEIEVIECPDGPLPAGLPLEPPCANHARIGTKQAKGLIA